MEKNSFFNEVQNELAHIKFLNTLEKEFNEPKFLFFYIKIKFLMNLYIILLGEINKLLFHTILHFHKKLKLI
jgi:hypothetical protein